MSETLRAVGMGLMLIGGVIGFMAPAPARAHEVTFHFEGVVTSGDPHLVGGILAGHELNGSFTFDADTADANPGNHHLGQYTGAITDLSYTIDSILGPYAHTFSPPPNVIEVHAEHDAPSEWHLMSGITGPTTFDSQTPAQFSITLISALNELFPNDHLEQTLNLSDFSTKEFRILFTESDHNHTVIGNLTALAPVPVPAAVYLFGSGLIGLVGLARRRHAL